MSTAGNRKFEAVVVGGGLAGTAAAAALGQAGLATLHVAPSGPVDKRTSALMMPTVQFLERSGLIEEPEAIGHRLSAIRIIDATQRLVRAPETYFQASEAGLSAFGWNFPNISLLERFGLARDSTGIVEIEAAPLEAMQATTGGWRLTLKSGQTIDAALIVGADGKGSIVRREGRFSVRERIFSQAALVADLRLGRGLGETSVEFHYPDGPFTLVPAGEQRANLVWIDGRAVLDQVCNSGPENLQKQLADKAQRLFGAVELASPIFVFPLSTLSVSTAGQNGIALIGEAAHAFPPIGAQGLNLGLRDVADLVSAVGNVERDTDWADRVSRSYAGRRAPDLARTGTMVDTLFRSLLTDMLPAQAARAGGLWALKLLPGLRRTAFGLGMGGK